MSQDTGTSTTTLMLTFLAGAALGAVAVALTTPKKGSDLRDDIADLGRRVKGKMGDLAERGVGAWEGAKKGASCDNREANSVADTDA